MKLPIENTALFPVEGVDLTSATRKAYYKELASFAREWLLGLPEGYLHPLKELFFQGCSSVNPFIAFRSRAPLLICLSTPSVTREFVIKTFDEYESFCACDSIGLYRMHFFGKDGSQWLKVVERLEEVVACLADDRAKCTADEREGGRSQYFSLYYRVFYRYQNGGGVAPELAQSIIEYVERNFETIQALPDSDETLVAFPKAFFPLLSGEVENPDIVYSDPLLLEFLQRFFTKQLPPTLQGIVERVYKQLDHPIQLIDGKVKF